MSAIAAAGEAGQGTLLIAPQFLTPADVAAHNLPGLMLQWQGTAWMAGEGALGPARLSSFDAIDAIVARLADRSHFPNLKQVVVAGHSGGGQFVQRYAVVAKDQAALRQGGVAIRYVIANPSSYAYFNEDRPRPDGTVAPFNAAGCAGFNRWKYGMDGRPAYAAGGSPQAIESDYVGRDVVYLLGTRDTNPNHSSLDKTCEAQAQGPQRFTRGHAYFDYLRNRHQSGFKQRLYDIPGVAHDGDKMLRSACGVAALFKDAQC
jgi:pimeloyl-ACP methyl ester carboxylesterase